MQAMGIITGNSRLLYTKKESQTRPNNKRNTESNNNNNSNNKNNNIKSIEKTFRLPSLTPL